MKNFVPSEQDVDVAIQLNDDAWGLVQIVGRADQSKIAIREALATLAVKSISVGLTVQSTPVDIIALTSESLDVRGSSSTA